MIKKVFLVLVVCLCFTFNAHSENLSTAYKMSLQYDPAFNAVRHEKIADETISSQGFAPLLPSLSLGAYVSKTNTDSDYYGDYNAKVYSASVSQPLFDAQRFFTWRQSKITASLGVLKLRSAELDLAQRLTTAYMNVVKAENQLKFKEAEADAAKTYYMAAKRLREHGEGTVADVHIAEARMRILNAEVTAAQNELRNARTNLQAITGMPITPLPVRNTAPFAAPAPLNVEEWIAMAKDKNPLILIAQKNLESAKTELKKRQFEYAPTINVTASATKSEKDLITYNRASDITVSSVGLNLRMPLFEGGLTRARVAEYKNRVEQYSKLLETTTSSVITKLHNTFSTTMNLLDRIGALKTAVESAEVALISTRRSYEAGSKSITDVLSATTDYYSALRNLSDAQCDYVVSVVNLKALAGILASDDFVTIDQWLGR